MAMSIAKWKEAKKAAFDALVKETAHNATVRGLTAKDAETLAKACKPPLMAFMDGYAAHFLGDDAKDVSKALDVPLGSPVENQAHVEIDTRQWNDAVSRLVAAGFQVSHTDADE